MDYIKRGVQDFVIQNLSVFPAVAILGSRQCGKSTLVKMMSAQKDNFLYLDLQNRDDLAKLSEPTLFFAHNADKTICLDEVQLKPDLFGILRSEIDRDRRNGGPSRRLWSQESGSGAHRGGGRTFSRKAGGSQRDAGELDRKNVG